MIATETPEYRKLELESSNEIIRHDARRTDRKYVEAALHIQMAGVSRIRMGRIVYDAGDFAQAAADWLSAAACFILAAQWDRARDGVATVRKLVESGRLSTERRDIQAALAEREGQLAVLATNLNRFIGDYRSRAIPVPGATQELLDFLLQHVRDFPGFAYLHFTIYRQASQLGHSSLAAKHLGWAAEFEPNDPEIVGRYGYQFITSGHPDTAVDLAYRFLHAHPAERSIRVMLAQALLSSAGGHTPDLPRAIEVLEPVLTDTTADARTRLSALFLAAAIKEEQGREAELTSLLSEFDQLAGQIQSGKARDLAAKLRSYLPKPRANGLSVSRLPPDPVSDQLYPSDSMNFPNTVQASSSHSWLPA